MIELKSVNKVYDDGFQALKNINLTFDEGKINVLIGPSGCGKTTTMKLLNRLVDHTDGTILVEGKDIQEMNPIQLRRQMGYVIQSIGLFPHMTIYDNVATVPKLLRWNKSKIDETVHRLLNLVNLEPETFKKRYPSELSGGQQQRIGVIRALAAEPDIILMDEPFSALDPISREQLQDELTHLQAEINKTIVFVTHDMDEAIKIADQIILMKDGEVVQKGSPHELLTEPKNDFVKEFIGTERLQKAETLPLVREMMNQDFVSTYVSESIDEALNKLINHNLTQLPVINNKQYAGFVTIKDLLKGSEETVSNVINTDQKTLKPSDEASQAMRLLKEQELNEVTVLTDQNEIAGVVNYKDISEALQNYYEKQQGVV
ncbi:ATP-binding cassette domain-containing protein [Filobacillus milosensis]|uniref:Quaternary amine transport ATP-binding protein n=1 Tax=Filobacillus milosensis TaxID=94137 RepID=A0A4Y8IQ23_9BACI|nr:betaine/proline/choline family ABC transporter ATP-binding protein [Filobacillus milosensis]TFB22793.1 ATP-binding cassette domain-containing protein [Filobacillus milosensis]